MLCAMRRTPSFELRNFSSAGVEMKPSSVSTEGIDVARSTRKPAWWTPLLRRPAWLTYWRWMHRAKSMLCFM